MQLPCDTAPDPEVLVTLVHGTKLKLIGDPRRWLEEDSQFRQSFNAHAAKNNLSAKVETFNWSGANSVFKRLEASSSLAKHLNVLTKKYPNAKQVVIAHSHGGNVALKALDDLNPNGRDVHVVTIATPFLDFHFLPVIDMSRFIPAGMASISAPACICLPT